MRINFSGVGPAKLFPLTAEAGGRYLIDSRGTPRPILGRTSWHIVSLSAANYQSYLQDTLSKGFNCIEMNAIYHWPASHVASPPTPPLAGNGEIPFTKRLDGGTWSGSLSYSNIANEGPDFTFPNESYWTHVDALLTYCANNGIWALMFPAYWGYASSNQGWQQEIVANGATKMQTYGAWIANRYKSYKNICWMLGGDYGIAPNAFSTPEKNAEQGMITGLQSVSGQLSGPHYGAEWEGSLTNGGSVGTDQADFGSTQTVNGSYAWAGQTATYSRNAYSHSPAIPAYAMEYPYDQEGPEALNYNPNAVQPCRRFSWQGWLNSIGGYCTGNGYVWPFGSEYTSHLNTQGAKDCSVLNAFIRSVPWYRLVPSGLGSIGTLITAGAGTIDTTNYVAAAATSLGDLLVAYCNPSAGAATIDCTKLRGTYFARWMDPTNGSYTDIGSFANTGTRQFTQPGNNAAGEGDWVLVVTA